MRRFGYVTWALGLALLLAACGGVNDNLAAATDDGLLAVSAVSEAGVKPVTYHDGPGGNTVCSELVVDGDFEFSSERVNYNGSFDADFPDGIDVTVTDGTSVAWTSTFPIGGVIVKGGPASHGYVYDPQATSDAGLVAPSGAGLSNLTFCWNEEEEPELDPLEVEKTAEGTKTKTYDWEIEKTAEPDEHEPGKFEFTVTATPLAPSYDFLVEGTITITNPNDVPVTITAIDDVLSDETVADVTCEDWPDMSEPFVMEAEAVLECTYVAEPGEEAEDNTVTVTAEDELGATFTFEDIAYEEVVINACVDVFDDMGSDRATWEKLGDVCVEGIDADPDAGTFTYTFSFLNGMAATVVAHPEPDPSLCEERVNFAKLVLEDGTEREDSATVRYCVEIPDPDPLMVWKDAEGLKKPTYDWELDKTAMADEYDPWTFTFTVTATPEYLGFTYFVTGTIRVTNPNDVPVTITAIEDVLSDGTVADVTCEAWDMTAPFVLDAGETLECEYAASPEDSAASNTVTVTADDDLGGTFTAPIYYSRPENDGTINGCVIVRDNMADPYRLDFDDWYLLGEVCAWDEKLEFVYTLDFGPEKDKKDDASGEVDAAHCDYGGYERTNRAKLFLLGDVFRDAEAKVYVGDMSSCGEEVAH